MNIKTIIGSIILVISLITGIFTIDSRYATSADLKKSETTLVKTLEQFKSDMTRDRLEQRFINLTDQAMQFKLLMKKNPTDIELKEDYQKIEAERQDVKKKLEERK